VLREMGVSSVFLEGREISRYRLLRMLASNTRSEVYLADDPLLNRPVAIKVTRTALATYPNAEVVKAAERLSQREAKAIAILNHPHILPLFDFGEIPYEGATLTYIVMPYCADGSLADWLKVHADGKPLPPEDAVNLVCQVASALQ